MFNTANLLDQLNYCKLLFYLYNFPLGPLAYRYLLMKPFLLKPTDSKFVSIHLHVSCLKCYSSYIFLNHSWGYNFMRVLETEMICFDLLVLMYVYIYIALLETQYRPTRTAYVFSNDLWFMPFFFFAKLMSWYFIWYECVYMWDGVGVGGLTHNSFEM